VVQECNFIRELDPAQILYLRIRVFTVLVKLMKPLKSHVTHTIAQLMEDGVDGSTVEAAVLHVGEDPKHK